MELLNKIQKELNVGKTLHNKFGNYFYRSAEQILEAVKPLLGKGILTLTDDVAIIGSRIYVKATATLKDGGESVSVSAFARETETKKGMDDAQVTGSASSYARKYALNGLFCLCDTQDPDDMDNTGAGKNPPKNPQPQASPPPSDAKQEAKQAQKELGDRFDQSAQKQTPPPAQTPPANRPAPTKEQRIILNLLRDYWQTKITSPNVQLSNNKIIDAVFAKFGHYPTLDECAKLKDEESPFYIKVDEVTNVVA